MAETWVVTGAFGYSGREIARRLLDRGVRVRTLTNSPGRRNPFGRSVAASPFRFGEPGRLADALAGADVLVNTYWIRFNHARFGHAEAVRNTEVLFDAARRAGVGRVVHTSITNPSADSPFSYFRGKARLEQALRESGVPHSILRPAVFFGGEDVLVNNIAYLLRRLPVFGVFGDGAYGIEPIHVRDFADLAVAEGAASGNRTLDAVGPEAFSYRGLVLAIAGILGLRRRVVSVPPLLGWVAGKIASVALRDVTITWDEIGGLMAGLLATGSPPAGSTRLTEWAARNRDRLGVRYASEMARRTDRRRDYGALSSRPGPG